MQIGDWAVRSVRLTHGAVWAAAAWLGAAHLAAQNLLPNPSFELGTTNPSDWTLTGQGGRWADQAYEGRRSVMVEGQGRGSSFWRSPRLALQPGGVYVLRFWARQDPGTRGGCAIAGPSRVNRDFHFTTQWQPYGFVFMVPDDGTNDYIRLGQWEVQGRVLFDHVELLPVQAVHQGDGVQLGEGESIQNGSYQFKPSFGWLGANYHRPLWQCRASFNSDRWVFSAGAELVYRFGLPDGPAQTAGQLRLALNYHTAGSLQVQASRNGRDWLPVMQLDGQHRSAQTNLPAGLFPAEAVWVRLAAEGPSASLQVNQIEYVASLAAPSPLLESEGETYFLEVRHAAPALGVGLQQVRLGEGRGQIRCVLAVTNRTAQPLPVQATLLVQGQASARPDSRTLGPGETVSWPLSCKVSEPGRHRVEVRLTDAVGSALFVGRTEVELGLLFDPRPGYWLQGTADVDVWWCEGGWKIGRTAGPPPPAPEGKLRPVHVTAARGEYEPAQLILSPRHDCVLSSVAAHPFRNAAGLEVPISVTVNEVAYVRVTHPTDSSCRRGWYPDPLPPLSTPLRLRAGLNQPIWLTFYVPASAPAGLCTAELELQFQQDKLRVPLQVQVYGFELPVETHLRSGFGLSSGEINRYHKLKTPEQRQAVYEKYLLNFAQHRISPYSFFDYAPIEVRFVGQGTNQHAQVDFTRFDQAAAKWLDEYRFNAFRLPLRGMGGGTFHSRYVGQLEGFKEGTPEHARLFADYLGQVERHLRQRGWLHKAYTYWFDEPDRKDYEFVVEGMKRIKAAAPGLRRMLTEQPEPELIGHVDIWCALTPEWTPEKVRQRRAAGEEVWWYLCTGPKAPYLTIFIDHPGIAMRLWPWQSWQYGVQGILVWATTYWTSSAAFPDKLQDPWTDPMSYVSGYSFKPGQVGYWGNGDGRFLYPPRRDPNTASEPALDGPINSVRWENLRDGVEDYEYFWLLEQQINRLQGLGRPELEPMLTQARRLLVVPEAISKDLTHFTTDVRLLLEHRSQVARMIETLQAIQ